jgi:hypothetical protein
MPAFRGNIGVRNDLGATAVCLPFVSSPRPRLAESKNSFELSPICTAATEF